MKDKSKKLPKPLFKPEECIITTGVPKFKKPSQLIIIGGGFSMKEGISKGLWEKLKDRFTLGINYSFHYFKSTLQTYVDLDFYSNEWDDLESLPLIVGKYHKLIEKEIRGQTIMLQINPKTYVRDLSTGVYKSSLCGLFSLSLGINLLDKGEIFLLGFDYADNGTKADNGKANTHFYQGEINHRGIGKCNYYKNKGRADRDFGVYSTEKKVKIYNVSLDSKINIFPRISYDKFFSMLDSYTFDQSRLRGSIRKRLEKKNIK